MDLSQPERKRMRLASHTPSHWHGSVERQLPPPPPQPPTTPYSSLATAAPYTTRPDMTQLAQIDRDRRPSDHASPYELQDNRRPSSGPSHVYHPLPPGPASFVTPRDSVIVKRDSSNHDLPYRSNAITSAASISIMTNSIPTSPPQDSPNRINQPSPNYDTSRPLLYPQTNTHRSSNTPISTNQNTAVAAAAYPGANSSVSEAYNHPPPYAPSNLPPPPPTQSSRNLDPYVKFSYPGPGSNPTTSTTAATTTTPTTSGRPMDQQVRKKAQRAAQACDCCRTAKAKCDEGRPSCSSCREAGKECRYRDPPPKQQDKTSADIMESLSRLESVMQKFMQQMDHLSNEVNEIKKVQQQNLQFATTLNSHAPVITTKEEPREVHSDLPVRYEYVASSTAMMSEPPPPSRPLNGCMFASASPNSNGEGLPSYVTPNPNLDDMHNASDDDDDDANATVELGPPKQPSIPVNHTTGAGRLLLVPPIKKMCADIGLHPKFKSEKYPYLLESKRGLLRLYGRGESNELILPTYDKESVMDLAETTPVDGNFEMPSPLAAGEEWGQIGGITLSTTPSHPLESTRGGGFQQEYMPDFSRETVMDLVGIYKENINNMHPILTPKQMDQLVESFLLSTQETRYRSKSAQATHVSLSSQHPESPGGQGGNACVKRKRSPISVDFSEMHLPPDYKPGYPFRSINTAIVLLCMALGKICQDKGKIPQMTGDQEMGSSASSFTGSFGTPSVTRNGIPTLSLPHNSLFGVSYGNNLVSESDRMHSRIRRQSMEGTQRDRAAPPSRLRNIDVIPGLIYFALATDILGNQMAGSSLQHVHANILAGLYHAQLARIMESAAYISNACRALQVILRPRLERFRKVIDQQKIVQAKDNPLVFAFWTCLQLESDIVAEIPCPQTGILTFEEDMPGPNLQAAHHDDGFDQNVIESYSAQLFLRKHLNSLHCMFYKPRDPNSEDKFTALVLANNKGDEPKFPSIELLSQSLNGIDVYAPTMRWMVDQPESPNDILGARLRAKYYGAQVITYRPFVLQVLERSEPPSLESSHQVTEQISDEYLSEVKAPVVKHDIKDTKDIDPKALEYVRLGLKALIKSTTAFHGLGHPGEKRIIVTNVWGTAHAQWGNVLTLQAAYMNPILNPLLLEIITKDELIMLIEKTMGFLALVGSPTSALSIDWKILDLTSRKNGLRSPSTLCLTSFPTFSPRNLQVLKMEGSSF